MIVRRFRGVTAVTASSFRRRPSMTTTTRARSPISSIVSSSFSSTAGVDDEKSAQRKRIVLTLYRQLLRWCDDTDEDIPLAQLVPPIHLSPPQINPDILEELAEASANTTSGRVGEDDKGPRNSNNLISSLHSGVFSPLSSVIKKTGITVHSVPNSGDAKSIVKAVFRMNATTTDERDQKEQVSMAFEWIKNLNELTQQLNEMKTKRENHRNREGVDFRIGQIVKHKTLAWRGVILGWNRAANTDKSDADSNDAYSQPTSLTQKPYKSIDPRVGDGSDEILYDVLLDWGDATLLSTSVKHASGLKNVFQSDLTLVDDRDLMRIRSATEKFQRFDPESQSFVPGDSLTYMYPNDKPTDDDDDDCSRWKAYENPSNESAVNISLGIQSLAKHLRQIILGYTSAPESRNLRLLSDYFERLTKLSTGDAVPVEDMFRGRPAGYRKSRGSEQQQESDFVQTKMKWELQKFVELAVEIEDILWARRKALETDRTIRFSLGEYVQHKKYGFRGVVVGWDPGTSSIDSREMICNYLVHPSCQLTSFLWQSLLMR